MSGGGQLRIRAAKALAAACLALMQSTAFAQTSPAANLLLDEAKAAIAAGRYVDALAASTSAVAAAPDDPVVHTRRAQLFDQLGHPDLAAHDYRMAVRLSPTDAGLQISLCSNLALSNHDLEGALAACNAAVDLTPDGADALSARGYLQLRRGAYAEAKKDYSAAIVLSPASPGEMFGLGVALTHLGQAKEGRGEIASATLDSAGLVSEWEVRGFGVLGEVLPGKPATKVSQAPVSVTDRKLFLNTGEILVELANGCGLIASASTDRSGPVPAWSGECRFGLIHGAGKLTLPGSDARQARFVYGRQIAPGEAGNALARKLGLAYEAAERAITP